MHELRLDFAEATVQRSKPPDDVKQPASQGELSESVRAQPATSFRTAASSVDNPFEIVELVSVAPPGGVVGENVEDPSKLTRMLLTSWLRMVLLRKLIQTTVCILM